MYLDNNSKWAHEGDLTLLEFVRSSYRRELASCIVPLPQMWTFIWEKKTFVKSSLSCKGNTRARQIEKDRQSLRKKIIFQ